MARTMPKQRVGQQTTGLAQGYAEARARGGGIVPGAHPDPMAEAKLPSLGQVAKKVVHGIGQAAHFVMSYNPYKKAK